METLTILITFFSGIKSRWLDVAGEHGTIYLIVGIAFFLYGICVFGLHLWKMLKHPDTQHNYTFGKWWISGFVFADVLVIFTCIYFLI